MDSTPQQMETTARLARVAADLHQRFDYDSIPISYVKRLLRERTIELWDARWQSVENNGQMNKFFPTINHRIKAKKFFRSDFHLCQALTSHRKLKAYLYRIGIKGDAMCEYCGGDEDSADHRIYECEKLSTREATISYAHSKNKDMSGRSHTTFL